MDTSKKISEPHFTTKIGNCDVFVLGTAHISQKSVDAVAEYIQENKPDTVCVELCEPRKTSMEDPDHWKKLDIFKVFKEKKMYLLFSSLVLSSFQKKIGFGTVKPGDELRKAMEEGKKIGSKIIPIDRNIQTTLKRTWAHVGFFSRMYLGSLLVSSLVIKEPVTEESIEKMKSEDVLGDLFTKLPVRYQKVKEVIIDERDQILAQNIRKAAKESKSLFAVVGAGHLQGIQKHISGDTDTSQYELIPTASFFSKLKLYFPPILILLAFSAYFYFKGGKETVDLLVYWVIMKSSLAMVGAIISLAHPVSILLAGIVSPLGNFNPILKPGWVCALSESFFRKPLVEDFEKIAEDSEHWKGFWKNRVLKIFLAFFLPQIGASIATFIVLNKGFQNF